MPTWNPDQYLKFMGERTQPSIDLAARIEIDDPQSVIDIGCGPGNSTRILRRKWKGTQLFGLDSSPEMIRKAKDDMPDIEWMVGDAMTFGFVRKYDIVFSNAALQWMKNHTSLVPRLFGIVNAGGALAVQVPANQDSPIQRAIVEVARKVRWSSSLAGCEDLMTRHPVEFYYDTLSNISSRFETWETIYYHIIPSHSDLIEWYKGTGMRPYLERLPDGQRRNEFEKDILEYCRDAYEIRNDGKILFPFRRIFFLAYKD